MTPIKGAIENAMSRSLRPMSVQAQVKFRASYHPRWSPMNASSARMAVKKSTVAVGMANASEIPGERFGTSRPKPRARNICGAIQNPSRMSSES